MYKCLNIHPRLWPKWSNALNRHRSDDLFRMRSLSTQTKPFDKILVANRGEIACRVIRTAKRLGIKTVAVYSSADMNALHASMADEKVLIGDGPSPRESYLRGEEVLDIALRTGSSAIHPGYGFLSENPAFATAVNESDVAFIGPSAAAIESMGSKSHSKFIMDKAKVPITPGYHGDNQDPEFLLHEARSNVGFPLLIKATMGGGGRGMRLVEKESDFMDALRSCKGESQSAFGDSRVILEKYLVNPRHIEIQIMADMHGNTVSLHERDCSLQRRHQKIIEEAPASDLPLEVRKRMGQMAVKAAKAVGYVNAGTVEFLLDSQSDAGDFYFCEMNTRLQVEHPVTELITGQDLVEWQLRVAAGETLPIVRQEDIPCVGHSMEARIYAENTSQGFLPATGHIHMHQPPTNPSGQSSSTTRVDTGITTGDEVSMYYDSMVSKLIVHSESREKCLEALVSSLKQYILVGVPNNIPFLIGCAEHPTFSKAGSVNTGFLDEYAHDMKVLEQGHCHSPLEKAICAFAASLIIEDRVSTANSLHGLRHRSPWSNYSGSWRAGGQNGKHIRVLKQEESDDSSIHSHLPNCGDASDIMCTSNDDGSFHIGVRGDGIDMFQIDGSLDSESGQLKVMIDGCKSGTFRVVSHQESNKGAISVWLWSEGHGCDTNYMFGMTFKDPLPRAARHDNSPQFDGGSCELRAPFTGKVTRINAVVGNKVEEKETVLVLEAMKMEHSIQSSISGIIGKLNCAVGDTVKEGTLLASVDDQHVETNTDESNARECF